MNVAEDVDKEVESSLDGRNSGEAPTLVSAKVKPVVTLPELTPAQKVTEPMV